jgi:excisionase family DNA binding protein
MPRTKKQPQPTPQPPVAAGPSASEVLTLAEAAAYLRVSENDVIGAATTQGLPGRIIGGEWRFAKAAIQQWLSVSEPTPEMRKAAQMAVVGMWKDDPDIEQIVEEAMRRRGREPGPDGTYGGYRPASAPNATSPASRRPRPRPR